MNRGIWYCRSWTVKRDDIRKKILNTRSRHFFNNLIAKSTKNFTGEKTTKFMKEELACKYDEPKALLNDQGINYESNQFEKFCKDPGIKKVLTRSA